MPAVSPGVSPSAPSVPRGNAGLASEPARLAAGETMGETGLARGAGRRRLRRPSRPCSLTPLEPAIPSPSVPRPPPSPPADPRSMRRRSAVRPPHAPLSLAASAERFPILPTPAPAPAPPPSDGLLMGACAVSAARHAEGHHDAPCAAAVSGATATSAATARAAAPQGQASAASASAASVRVAEAEAAAAAAAAEAVSASAAAHGTAAQAGPSGCAGENRAGAR